MHARSRTSPKTPVKTRLGAGLRMALCALFVVGLGMATRGRADTLDPEQAASLVVVSQRVAGAFDSAWQSLDRLLPPFCGSRARLVLAEAEGGLQQALGSPQFARQPWLVAADVAENRYADDALYYALEQEAEAVLVLFGKARARQAARSEFALRQAAGVEGGAGEEEVGASRGAPSRPSAVSNEVGNSRIRDSGRGGRRRASFRFPMTRLSRESTR